ncbi:MAG: hypothetical protein LBF83_03895 [Spirochaetaceae bacterium]|jgi:hypothetical protein|nr:hypothetical protein [Spirochaetaceae bacterium]
MNSPSSINGAALLQTIVNNACNKLEQKNAGFILIRINQLDSLLSGIEKRLAQAPMASRRLDTSLTA